MSCHNCGGSDESVDPGELPTPEAGGPAGPSTPGLRTRDFTNTWDTGSSVPGPMGGMNAGYVHNMVSTEGQWSRGELPDMGYGYAFALRRPGLMREPGTNLGTINLAAG